MTTWIDQNTIETGWNAGDGIDRGAAPLYNIALAYNVDFLTYNGYYVEANTDWVAGSSIETAWKDET